MATLAEIYGTVPQICFRDEAGVFLDGKKIALDNTVNSGYIRDDGFTTYEVLSRCDGRYEVTRQLVFVGCAPYADPDSVRKATVAALSGGGSEIIETTLDKKAIADEEGIDISKFTGVAMVLVRYRTVEIELLNPNCDYDICIT